MAEFYSNESAKRGYALNYQNSEGYVLYGKIRNNYHRVLSFFKSEIEYKIDFDQKDWENKIMVWACENKYVDILKYLKKNNVNINGKGLRLIDENDELEKRNYEKSQFIRYLNYLK